MIKGSNKYRALAGLLEGIYTIETLCKRLKIDRTKAIYVIHRLRKLGYVETSYGRGKKRLYFISPKNINAVSYTQIINKVSPIKLATFNPYYIHGRTPSYEEVFIYALKRKEIRYLIASLALFKKISNWSHLYNLAKKEGLVVEIVALYEVARKTVRKIRRMPVKFINNAKKIMPKHFRYIIKPFSSNDFKDIEKKWKVYIPLNRADLEDYKR